MPKKIDPKILHEEINGKFRVFYPYFLGLYVLSLIVTYFSPTWSSFFYWPAFHTAVIFFTVLFLFTSEFNSREKLLLQRILKSFKNIKWSLRPSDAQITQQLIHLSKKIRIALSVALDIIVLVRRSAWHLLNVIAGSVEKGVLSVSRRNWVKVVIVAAIMTYFFVKGIGAIDFLVLFFALISVIFIQDGRLPAAVALIFMAVCSVSLILKKGPWAMVLAVYGFYFLVITVITEIREIKKEKTVDNSSGNGWQGLKKVV